MIRIANHSPNRFTGWIRRNVDSVPPHSSGIISGVRYQIGQRTGEDTYACHLLVDLAPGERRELDLFASDAAEPVRHPPNPASWYGGPLKLNGEELQMVSLTEDGPSWVAYLRLRHGNALVSEVWLRQYPGEPWADGRILTGCSDPRSSELLEQVPDLSLQFGTGIMFVEGREWLEPLSYGRDQADGQGFALPFQVLWREHATAGQLVSFSAIHRRQIGCVGIEQLLPDGNPVYPATFNPVAWTRQHLPKAIEALHDYRQPTVGIAPTSTQTGAQEDQCFVRGEALLQGGAGAEHVAYLSALKYAQRPCHHYESDGTPLDLDRHPGMFFWSSRPHRLSQDRLGKDRDLAPWDVPGEWFGADRQHWLLGTLAAADRIFGCPLLQRLLEHQATAFLAGETIDPALSTSHSGSARSPGYAGMVAVHLYRGLANRDLAERVKQRMRRRIREVYIPELIGQPGDLWDIRADDRILADLDLPIKAAAWAEAKQILDPNDDAPAWLRGLMASVLARKGDVRTLHRDLQALDEGAISEDIQQIAAELDVSCYGAGVMLWQQSLGAYGIELASSYFGVPEGRELALFAAKAVMDHGWRKEGETWQFWENVGYLLGDVLPDHEYEEGVGAHRTGWFDSSWSLPGLAVVLRHEPDNEVAREIWAQVASNGGSWVPPGVPA
jgi:hypothetical protein